MIRILRMAYRLWHEICVFDTRVFHKVFDKTMDDIKVFFYTKDKVHGFGSL